MRDRDKNTKAEESQVGSSKCEGEAHFWMLGYLLGFDLDIELSWRVNWKLQRSAYLEDENPQVGRRWMKPHRSGGIISGVSLVLICISDF